MFEDSVSSIPSIWASMNSWFTPTVFFVLLNVVIGTIALTSSLTNQRQEQQEEKQAQDDPNPQKQPLLTRSLSVLERLRSINFYSSKSEESHQSSSISLHFNPTPDPDSDSGPFYASEPTNQREASETEILHVSRETHSEAEEEKDKEEEARSLDEVYSELRGRPVDRTKSDTKPASGEMPERLPARMRKSASSKSPFAHFEEDDVVEARRPATVREGKATGAVAEGDDEVDAKADDFINKFKQQLKLQRLDSIVRDKETINRGSGK